MILVLCHNAFSLTAVLKLNAELFSRLTKHMTNQKMLTSGKMALYVVAQ